MKAEEQFFSALGTCLGRSQVLRKGEPVRRFFAEHGSRLLSDHNQMDFEDPEKATLDEIFRTLHGSPTGGSPTDLTRFVDGMLSPDCPSGPCIIEFDEEQHFSPFRHATLRPISETIEVRYDLSLYNKYCLSHETFVRFLEKHRIAHLGITAPCSTQSLLEALSGEGDLGSNGYVAPKKCFPFLGGRIAQRAYYDVLRDFFHRSKSGRKMGLKPIVRVSIYQIEERVGGSMEKAPFEAIVDAVASVLATSVKLAERACGKYPDRRTTM